MPTDEDAKRMVEAAPVTVVHHPGCWCHLNGEGGVQALSVALDVHVSSGYSLHGRDPLAAGSDGPFRVRQVFDGNDGRGFAASAYRRASTDSASTDLMSNSWS